MIDCDVNWKLNFLRSAFFCRVFVLAGVENKAVSVCDNETFDLLSYFSRKVSELKGIKKSLEMYIENMDSLSSLMLKRHYKKDSRYVNDLYTLTYDNCESLNTISLISSIHTFHVDSDNDDNEDNRVS